MDTYNQKIGAALAQYRKAHAYTIKDMARITGISTALLSELERGIGNPTLSSLETLAHTMGISLSLLLEQDIPNASLVKRKSQRTLTEATGAQGLYEILAVSPVRSHMELLLLDLKPHTYSNETFSVHPYWEEIAYVISGTVLIEIEQEYIALNEGDTIRILPGRKHRFYNKSDASASVLFAQAKN